MPFKEKLALLVLILVGSFKIPSSYKMNLHKNRIKFLILTLGGGSFSAGCTWVAVMISSCMYMFMFAAAVCSAVARSQEE